MIDVATGQVQRLAIGFKPAWFDISPNGDVVAFTSAKGYESLKSQQLLYDLVVVSLSDARPRVVAANIQLDYAGMTVSWSPNGKMLSYITSSSGGPVKGDCFIVPVTGGEPRNTTSNPHPYFSNTWRAPLWDSSSENIYLISSDAVWKSSVKTYKAEEIARIHDRRIIETVGPREGGRLFSPDGGRSMLVVTRDDQTKRQGFYRIDLSSGGETRLLEENKSYGDIPTYRLDVTSDGKHVVFVAEDAAHSAEIWLTDVEFKRPKQMTRVNPNLDGYAMGTSRLIEWRTLDGDIMRGALLLPSNYHEGQRYPIIVRIYPGSNLSDNLNSFGLVPHGAGVENEQLFATRGYAVLLADSARPKISPMRGIASSVLPCISKLVELGIADPERIGLIGHSNGGYGALSLLVQTTRFRAAVCSGCLGNVIGHYGFMRRDGSSSWAAYQEEALGLNGPPWQYPNKYIENSPLFHLDKIQTPLLLVHGGEDNVVPSFLADEIFVGLRRLGREVEYAKYDGERHWEGAWGHVNQVDYLNRVINWFDRWLK